MKLGDRVIAQGTIRRTGDYVPHGRDRVYWVPVVWKNMREGIFIGFRHLSNGEVEYISYEDEKIYHPKEHFDSHVLRGKFLRVDKPQQEGSA